MMILISYLVMPFLFITSSNAMAQPTCHEGFSESSSLLQDQQQTDSSLKTHFLESQEFKMRFSKLFGTKSADDAIQTLKLVLPVGMVYAGQSGSVDSRSYLNIRDQDGIRLSSSNNQISFAIQPSKSISVEKVSFDARTKSYSIQIKEGHFLFQEIVISFDNAGVISQVDLKQRKGLSPFWKVDTTKF